MNISTTILLVTIFSFTACGSDHHSKNKPLLMFDSSPSLINTLKKKIRQHKRCTLKKNCRYENLIFQPQQPKKQGHHTILILDSERQPAFSSSFFRYKNRVLRYLRQLEHHKGYYSSYQPVLKTPQLLNQLYAKLRDDSNPFSILENNKIIQYDILKLHHHTRFLVPNRRDISHGEYVFFILADANPKSSFIVAPFPELTPTTFCSMSSNWQDIIQYYKHSFESLSYFIKHYHVRYLNLSYATTIERLQDHNNHLCGGSLSNSELFSFFKLKSSFLDNLSLEHPNVLFVAAIPNSNSSLVIPGDPRHVFSCKKRSNVIRVGFWNQLTHNITAEGIRVQPKFLPNDQQNLVHCGDIFINGGIDETKLSHAILHMTPHIDSIPKDQHWWHAQSLHIVHHGVYSYPIRAMSTSWAAPLALSLIRYLDLKHQFLFEKPIQLQTIRKLTQGKLLDPLKFKQLEKFNNKRQQ